MENNTKQILVAAGSGLAIGALLGILFAPAEGKETRQNIAKKAGELKDITIDKKSEISTFLSSLKDDLTDSFNDLKEDTQEDLKRKINDLENLIKKS